MKKNMQWLGAVGLLATSALVGVQQASAAALTSFTIDPADRTSADVNGTGDTMANAAVTITMAGDKSFTFNQAEMGALGSLVTTITVSAGGTTGQGIVDLNDVTSATTFGNIGSSTHYLKEFKTGTGTGNTVNLTGDVYAAKLTIGQATDVVSLANGKTLTLGANGLSASGGTLKFAGATGALKSSGNVGSTNLAAIVLDDAASDITITMSHGTNHAVKTDALTFKTAGTNKITFAEETDFSILTDSSITNPSAGSIIFAKGGTFTVDNVNTKDTRLAALTVQGATTLTIAGDDGTDDALYVNNLSLSGTSDLAFATNKATLDVATMTLAAADEHSITATSVSSTLKIGTALDKRLKSIAVAGNNTLTLDVPGEVKVQTLNFSADVAATLSLSSNVTKLTFGSNAGTGGHGIIVTNGTIDVDGTVSGTALNNVTHSGAAGTTATYLGALLFDGTLVHAGAGALVFKETITGLGTSVTSTGTGSITFEKAVTTNVIVSGGGSVKMTDLTGNVTMETVADGTFVASGKVSGDVTLSIKSSITATEVGGTINVAAGGNTINVPKAGAIKFTADSITQTLNTKALTADLQFNGNTSSTFVLDGVALTGAITTGGDNKGILTLKGIGSISGDVGASSTADLATLSLQSATQSFAGAVYADKMTVDSASQATFAKSSIISTSLDNDGRVKIGNGVTIKTGTGGILGSGVYEITVGSGANQSGVIDFGVNPVALSGRNLEFKLATGASLSLPTKGTTYKVALGDATGTLPTLASPGFGWTMAFDSDFDLILTAAPVSLSDRINDPRMVTLATSLRDRLNGTKLSQIAFAVAQTTDKALLEKVIHQATGGNPSNAGSGMVSAVTSSVTTASATAVDSRMASLQMAYADGLSGRDVAGVNTGSAMMASGNVWTKVGGTSATQRMYEGSTGFRSTGYHGIIGADAQVTERVSAGLALSYADTTVKHHDWDTGNKTDVASTHLMLYATGQVTDAIYVTGQLGGGKHQLKARRDLSALKAADPTINVGTGMARATYDITDMQAKLETGYRFAFPTYGASLTPYVAVSFNDSESDKYKERDGGILNREVASRRDDSIAGIVGFRSRVDVHEQASMEVRGAWKQDFKKKRSKIDFNFADEASIRFTNEGARPVRSAVMMGAGVTTQVAPDMDLTVDYDAELRRRYVGHTGSLKLKFKF